MAAPSMHGKNRKHVPSDPYSFSPERSNTSTSFQHRLKSPLEAHATVHSCPHRIKHGWFGRQNFSVLNSKLQSSQHQGTVTTTIRRDKSTMSQFAGDHYLWKRFLCQKPKRSCPVAKSLMNVDDGFKIPSLYNRFQKHITGLLLSINPNSASSQFPPINFTHTNLHKAIYRTYKVAEIYLTAFYCAYWAATILPSVTPNQQARITMDIDGQIDVLEARLDAIQN